MHPARFSLAAIIALSACTPYGATREERADVPMRDAMGRELGTLALATGNGGLMLTGDLRGLPPGAHGIHLHMTGRCEPPFETAGEHWNPMSRQHGMQNPQGPHFGDLLNVSASADGSAAVNLKTAGGTLGGADPLLDGDGAAVVLHVSGDDHRTDPSGNSGDRIACGVVRGN